MFAETLFTSLTAVYFVLMSLISVVGTATLLKLMIVLMKNESQPRSSSTMDLSVEDA